MSEWSVLVFLGTFVASYSWSVDRSRTTVQLTMMIVTTLGAWVLARRWSTSSLLGALVVSQHIGCLASVVAIGREWQFSRDRNGNWAGVYFTRNSLAPVAAVGMVSLLVLAIDQRHRWGRFNVVAKVAVAAGGAMLVALDCALLAGSGSMTSALGAGTSLVVATLAVCSARKWQFVRTHPGVMGALSLLAAALATLIGLAARGWLGRLLQRDATFDGRTIIWRVVGEFIWARPLRGWGWGAVWSNPGIHGALRGVGYDVDEAHNGYLETILGAGMLGLAALLGVLWAAATAAWRDATLRRGAAAFWPAIALAYAVLVNLGESFIGPNLLPWVLIVLVATSRSCEPTRSCSSPTRQPGLERDHVPQPVMPIPFT